MPTEKKVGILVRCGDSRLPSDLTEMAAKRILQVDEICPLSDFGQARFFVGGDRERYAKRRECLLESILEGVMMGATSILLTTHDDCKKFPGNFERQKNAVLEIADQVRGFLASCLDKDLKAVVNGTETQVSIKTAVLRLDNDEYVGTTEVERVWYSVAAE